MFRIDLSIVGLAVSLPRLRRPRKHRRRRFKSARPNSLDFPTGGILRMTNSIGMLTVIGWDQPRVEVTTIKTTGSLPGQRKRQRLRRTRQSENHGGTQRRRSGHCH